jgi:hypothetical protein
MLAVMNLSPHEFRDHSCKTLGKIERRATDPIFPVGVEPLAVIAVGT